MSAPITTYFFAKKLTVQVSFELQERRYRQFGFEIIVKIPSELEQYLSHRLSSMMDFLRRENGGDTAVFKVKPHRILSRIFENQGAFYSYLGFRESEYRNWHPDDADFHFGCDGWNKFTNYLRDNPRIAENVCNLIAKLVAKEISKDIEEGTRFESLKYESAITIDFVRSSNDGKFELPKVQLAPQLLLVTNDGVYKLSLSKLENVKTLDDLKDEIQNTIKRIYEMQLEARVHSLKNRVKELEEKVREVETKAFLNGLKAYAKIKQMGWELRDDHLYYPKTIRVERIKLNGKIYENTLFDWYVKGIKVKIKERIENGDVWIESHNHPNVDDEGRPCLGDLKGVDLLTFLENAVELFKTANLDSAFWSPPDEELEELKQGGTVWRV